MLSRIDLPEETTSSIIREDPFGSMPTKIPASPCFLASLRLKLKGLFTNFGDGVMTALKIAFAPFFLAYKIFQKAKDFVSGFFGGGNEASESSVSSESTAGKGGKVRQTVSSMTVRNGQVV